MFFARVVAFICSLTYNKIASSDFRFGARFWKPFFLFKDWITRFAPFLARVLYILNNESPQNNNNINSNFCICTAALLRNLAAAFRCCIKLRTDVSFSNGVIY